MNIDLSFFATLWSMLSGWYTKNLLTPISVIFCNMKLKLFFLMIGIIPVIRFFGLRSFFKLSVLCKEHILLLSLNTKQFATLPWPSKTSTMSFSLILSALIK